MLFKAGHQIGIIHKVHILPTNLFGDVGQWERHTPVEQYAIQQVDIGAVILDVAFQFQKHLLVILRGTVIDILHVGAVHFQYPETGIRSFVFLILEQFSLFWFCIQLLFNLFPGPADTLFPDFTDVLVSRLVCLWFRIGLFRQLHHDKLTVTTIFRVELHNRMSGSCGAGEEVEDNTFIW